MNAVGCCISCGYWLGQLSGPAEHVRRKSEDLYNKLLAYKAMLDVLCTLSARLIGKVWLPTDNSEQSRFVGVVVCCSGMVSVDDSNFVSAQPTGRLPVFLHNSALDTELCKPFCLHVHVKTVQAVLVPCNIVVSMLCGKDCSVFSPKVLLLAWWQRLELLHFACCTTLALDLAL